MKKYLYSIFCLCTLLSAFLIVQGCSGPSERESYRIARDITWYPLNLMGKENNMLGFMDDVILTVAREKNIKVELVFTGGNTLLIGLQNDMYDGVVAALAPTSLSERDFYFSDPIIRLGPVLVVPVNSDVTALSDLEDKVIGIQRGSASAFDTVRFPSVIITPYENLMLALDTLAKKQIDAVIMEAIPAFVYTQNFYREKLKIATPPLTSLGLRIVSRVGPREENFTKLFNEGLNAIREKGVYDDLIMKWGLYNPEKANSVRDQ